MLRSLRSSTVFFREFIQRFHTTGSIVPSSSFLARAMTRHLKQRGDHPIRVLEVGPGTGAFTGHIVRSLRDGDRFDLVELNESFVAVLNDRFRSDRHWQAVAPFSEVHAQPLQEFAPDDGYDFIISGLPHVNFPADLVESIMQRYHELLKPGGVLSYFEYAYIRSLRGMVGFGAERRRIAQINSIVNGHFDRCRIARDTVLLNVPPAWAQHLRREPTPAEAS